MHALCAIPVLLVLIFVQLTFCANILYLATMPSPSHHIFNKALAYGLVRKGHNVTYLSPESDKSEKPKNFTFVFQEGVYQKMNEKFNINKWADSGAFSMVQGFFEYSVSQCQFNLEAQGSQTIFNYPSDFKFDLILIDVTVGSCFYPMMHRFRYPPSVAITPFLLPQFTSNSFGNMLFPSFIPWYALPYSKNMNFIERVWNTFYTYLDIYYRYTYQFVRERELAAKVFGDDIPSMIELERHFSLVLANTNPLMDHVQPLAPNIIPIGGLHTGKPKALPQDLLRLIENSKNGVIVFSLGTNIRSDRLTKEAQKELLKAFSQLKETVLWKFESEIDNLPKNVIVRKWLPQGDILGHPNVKLFIGHGGALSTQEAIYHGVPMILVPFIIDQYVNAVIICEKKIGVQLDHKKISEEYVLKKLTEVLDNNEYTKNIKKLSQAFKDSPETPLERGIFWVEYVLRNNGADFLSLPSRDMPLYQSTGLDVLLFFIVVFLFLLLVVYKIVLLIFNLFTEPKKLKTN